MVLSLGLFEKYRRTSLLLFGFSLAIKQIAIFLMPLYLIWEYQQSRSWQKVFVAGLWMAVIPLLASIPFLIWNAEGFIKSIVFSATRIALDHFGAESIDVILPRRNSGRCSMPCMSWPEWDHSSRRTRTLFSSVGRTTGSARRRA
jgi:hypothetical protein